MGKRRRNREGDGCRQGNDHIWWAAAESRAMGEDISRVELLWVDEDHFKEDF